MQKDVGAGLIHATLAGEAGSRLNIESFAAYLATPSGARVLVEAR
jgi:hypothetical protein